MPVVAVAEKNIPVAGCGGASSNTNTGKARSEDRGGGIAGWVRHRGGLRHGAHTPHRHCARASAGPRLSSSCASNSPRVSSMVGTNTHRVVGSTPVPTLARRHQPPFVVALCTTRRLPQPFHVEARHARGVCVAVTPFWSSSLVRSLRGGRYSAPRTLLRALRHSAATAVATAAVPIAALVFLRAELERQAAVPPTSSSSPSWWMLALVFGGAARQAIRMMRLTGETKKAARRALAVSGATERGGARRPSRARPRSGGRGRARNHRSRPRCAGERQRRT